jgi:hypothetical protein
MDEPMDKKGKKGKNRTSDDAPSYMQPRKPVLEEPLMGEVTETAETDRTVEDKAPGGEDQAELESSSLALDEEGAEKSEGEEVPYSPYFPRGVYEDAQAVEEYYGRGEEKESLAREISD